MNQSAINSIRNSFQLWKKHDQIIKTLPSYRVYLSNQQKSLTFTESDKLVSRIVPVTG